MIYLVRHAKAGTRSAWVGDDRPRPLTSRGEAQSQQLAVRLAPLVAPTAGELWSSPYARCRQTLEPLATLLARPVVNDERLAEAAGFHGALDAIAEAPDGSVLCSHGDVIPEVVAALDRRGCRLLTEPDFRKAAVWVLTRDSDGVATEASVWPPPEDTIG